jgi:hypothetical protein
LQLKRKGVSSLASVKARRKVFGMTVSVAVLPAVRCLTSAGRPAVPQPVELLEHTFAEKMLSAMRNKFGGHVEIYPVN